MSCKHPKKFYSQEVWTTAPPKVKWICADCLEVGIELMYPIVIPRDKAHDIEDAFTKMVENEEYNEMYRKLIKKKEDLMKDKPKVLH